MTERIGYSVVIDVGCYIVGFRLHVVGSIAHGYAYPRCPEDGYVVAAVAECYALADVQTLVCCKQAKSVSLVGSASGDIGELRVPACRDAVRHARHHLPFLADSEERSKLKDGLTLEVAYRLVDVYVCYAKLLHEDLVENLMIVVDYQLAFSADYDRIAVVLGVVEHSLHVIVRYLVDVYVVIANESVGTVECDISIDNVAYLSYIGNDGYRPSGGDVYPSAIVMKLIDGIDRRLWNLMCLETDQSTVNIEECCA